MEDEELFFGNTDSFFGGPPPQGAEEAVIKYEHANASNGVIDHLEHEIATEKTPVSADPAASHLAGSHQLLDTAQSQQQQYYAWLNDYLQQSCSAGQDLGISLHDVPSIIGAIYTATVGRNYLHYLKEVAEAGRELERLLREAEALQQQLPPAASLSGTSDSATAHASTEQYLASIQTCTEALSAALYAQEASSYYAGPAWTALPQLQAAAGSLDVRLQQGRYSLYQRILKDLQDVLDAAGWPPALTPSSSGNCTSHGDAHHAAGDGSLEQHMDGAPHHTAPQDGEFKGFGLANHGPVLLARLNGLLACLNRLQMVTERNLFQVLQQHEAGAMPDGPLVQEGPLLWSMSQLTAQLQARLQAHFSPLTEAGRLDKPEWLLKTVIGFVQDFVGYMEELQPSIMASGLQGHYHACVEFARAVREAVRAVLRSSRLPALLQSGGQYDVLWIMQVDAIIAFERQMAPYLGALHMGQDGDVPESLAVGSCLNAITQEPDFLAAWAAAEMRTASAQLLPLAPHSNSEGNRAAAMVGHGSGSGQAPGWKTEFNPPAFAERLADIIAGLVERSRHVPGAQEQRLFLELAVGPLLEHAEQAMTSILAAHDDCGADERNATFESRMPWVCACVTASRYLHHQLSEMLAGPALHRIHQEQLKVQAGESAGGAPDRELPTGSTSGMATPSHVRSVFGASAPDSGYATPSRAAGFADVVMRPSFVPSIVDPPVLVARTAALGATHRQWCLRIAQEVAKSFGRLALKYREEVVRAPVYPTHLGPADSASPQLLPALALMEQHLALLAIHLDGPSFRDIWRAVSVPINRFMFNHIATEARFTPGGASQFLADAAALAGTVAPYTAKPAAHFREMLAACRLLTLSDDEAGEVVRRVSTLAATAGQLREAAGREAHHMVGNGSSAAPGMGAVIKKDPLLVHLGVVCLTPHQVIAVIERRV